jgi:acetyl esterase/lipase
MKKIILTAAVVFLLSASSMAQQVIRLYDGKAPGSESWTWSEKESAKNQFNTRVIYNVADPTITAYLPSAPNGTAVIIAPGGAFHTLSIDSEGIEVAKWLNAKGVTAFVLKYRVVKSETDDPVKELMGLMIPGNFAKLDSINGPIVQMAMMDGLAAMKYVRSHADTYHIDPKKIGFMGFSAGATVTMSTVYNATDVNRPNFVAPIYGYEKAIIGSEVPKVKTPIFICAASNDALGFATHSVHFYLKWLAAGQPAELHMYEQGSHGFGMRKNNIPTDTWIERFGDWLKLQGYLPGQ